MNISEIKSLIASPDYDFLRTNDHLKNRLIFLTLSGSLAYGTNVETSDVDIRGCTMNSTGDILGFGHFEQYVDDKTDTVIYGFNKLISLLINCNPNTIELLGCKPEHYIMLNDIGREVLSNRKLFLSQRAVHSFSSFATQQLRRLENALARDVLPQSKKEEHIRQSLQRAVDSFVAQYEEFDYGSIHLHTEESTREDLERETLVDIHLTNYPAREFGSLVNNMSNVVGNYEKLNKRNRKKDNEHLNKHAMHLIRLYLMCLDILEKEEIITYREKEHDLLMSIRRGDFQNADCTYRQEFFDMVSEYETRLEYARQNTSLPPDPDLKRIEEFVMSVNRRALDVG